RRVHRMTSGSTTAYFIETARLGFRPWTREDSELAVGLWSDPDVVRFIQAGGAPSRESALARLDAEIATQAQHGISYWPTALPAGGAHVVCGGPRPPRREPPIHGLGAPARPAFGRRGFALEPARAVIAHAFDRLLVHALFAGHTPANHGSREMLDKLGFRY